MISVLGERGGVDDRLGVKGDEVDVGVVPAVEQVGQIGSGGVISGKLESVNVSNGNQ